MPISLKNLLISSCLAGLGLLIPTLALEVYIRWLEPAPQLAPTSPIHAGDRPHYYYKASGTRSFKNRPFSVNKPKNVFRIAAIGDSFTYPHLIHFDDAYPQRLERILNLNATETLRSEVINYGLSGLSTVQEIHEVKRALHAKPDVLLLEITLNDIQNYNFQKHLHEIQERYPIGELEITDDTHPFLYHIKSLQFVAKRIHRWKSYQGFIDYNLDLYKDPEHWKPFKAALLEIRRQSRKARVPLYVFIMPFFHTPLDEQYPFSPIHEKITGFLKRKKIKHLDFYQAFKDLPHQRLHVLPGQDAHPNEIAHRIVADTLYEWLSDEGAIPETLKIEKLPYHHY